MLICTAAAALAATLIAGPAAFADPAPSGDAPASPASSGDAGTSQGPASGDDYAFGMPVSAPAPQSAPELKQSIYHLKGKGGVPHDVVIVPISDDPTQPVPITLPNFGFQKFAVADTPRHRRGQDHWEKNHREHGKGQGKGKGKGRGKGKGKGGRRL